MNPHCARPLRRIAYRYIPIVRAFVPSATLKGGGSLDYSPDTWGVVLLPAGSVHVHRAPCVLSGCGGVESGVYTVFHAVDERQASGVDGHELIKNLASILSLILLLFLLFCPFCFFYVPKKMGRSLSGLVAQIYVGVLWVLVYDRQSRQSRHTVQGSPNSK